jgi:hypothetical protein
LPSVTAVATVAEERSNKCCCVDGDMPSLTTQYGTFTTMSKSSMSDEELLNYFDKHLQGREKEMVCGNNICICLNIFTVQVFARLLQSTYYGLSGRKK